MIHGPQLERLWAVAVSPSGKWVAVGGERDRTSDSSVHFFELPKGKAKQSAPVGAPLEALAWLADDRVVGGTRDGRLLVWGPENERPVALAELSLGAAPIRYLTCTADQILAVTADGSVSLTQWSEGQLQLLTSRSLTHRGLRVAALDARGELLVVGGDDGTLRALPLEDLEGDPRAMPISDQAITALALTDDGRAVVGLRDGGIHTCFLEGAADVEERSGDNGHQRAVSGLAFGPELTDDKKRTLPRRLFSIGYDGVLKSWELDSKRKPRTEYTQGAELRAFSWGPSKSRKPELRGGTLTVVDRERRLLLFTLSHASELQLAETVDPEFERLAEALRSPRAPVREQALNELGQLVEDDARCLIERALAGDTTPSVRATAANALGMWVLESPKEGAAVSSGVRNAKRALATALSDGDDKVRQAVFGALVSVETETPMAALRAAIGSKHGDIRARAVAALPEHRGTSPLVPGLITRRLSDSTEAVRKAAFAALRTIEPNVVARAQAALRHGPPDIRVAALYALARDEPIHDWGAPQVSDATRTAAVRVVEQRLDDDDAEVRAAAFLVFCATRPRLIAYLLQVNPRLRRQLQTAEAEGRFVASPADPEDAGAGEVRDEAEQVDEDDRAPLLSAMACQWFDQSLRGARSLASLGDSRASGALLALSRDAEPENRRAALAALLAAALRLPHDTRLTQRLEHSLDDDDANVRAKAFEALAELAKPTRYGGRLELAALALASSHADTRAQALNVLLPFAPRGELSLSPEARDEATRLLGAALDDEAEKVRAEAFRTLWAWHERDPRRALERARAARHADVRLRVIEELSKLLSPRGQGKDTEPHSYPWADLLLLALVGDSTAAVGKRAYDVLLRDKRNEKRIDYHLVALDSPRPEVKIAGCRGSAEKARQLESPDELRGPILQLVEHPRVDVQVAAVEAMDTLMPQEQYGFALAFGSKFYLTRVRAAELCGKRRDDRGIDSMTELLGIAEEHFNRPPPELRQRAARAIADVGARRVQSFCLGLLEDGDPVVREMGSRGLATSCRPGDEELLVKLLTHDDLAVRSWIAEGLSRLGDSRAVPVLVGTLNEPHRPLRMGAIVGLVALGPDGARGVLRALEDSDREIQDFSLAIIVARDVMLAEAGEEPDLLLSALSARDVEVRFVAARVLEARMAGEERWSVAAGLVGPAIPERASDRKDWPKEEERKALLNVLVRAIASDDPLQRYAAAQVLALRRQPTAFWREAKRLAKPTSAARPWVPHTNWDDAKVQHRKRGWLRAMVRRRPVVSGESGTERALHVIAYARESRRRVVPLQSAEFDRAEAERLLFGVYAGLIRQTPARGESDESHRTRRDAVTRIGEVATSPPLRSAVVAVLRAALADPHHLVRKAAFATLRKLHEGLPLVPLELALGSAGDVGRPAVDELIELAQSSEPWAADARSLALAALDASSSDVRRHALTRVPKLFAEGSLEPWLLALESHHADIRLSVVDRIVESRDPRVTDALSRALESDHEDLRFKVAEALARRGDARTVDVLAGFLRSEEAALASRAMEALVLLAHARRDGSEARRAAAETVARRLEEVDSSAARPLVQVIERIGDSSADESLLALLSSNEAKDAELQLLAFEALVSLAKDTARGVLRLIDGTERQRYVEPQLLRYVARAAESDTVALRRRVTAVLRDVDDATAEELLVRLSLDRDSSVRVDACEAQAFRTRVLKQASTEGLTATLRGGRRELLLPAATGLAERGDRLAFQPLVLLVRAGEPEERIRATMALGSLGDDRALEVLEPLVDTSREMPPEDAQLVPYVAESLAALLPKLPTEDRERVAQTLRSLWGSGSVSVRQHLLTGYRRGGDDQGRVQLERAAADRFEDSLVRAHAVLELGRLGCTVSEPALAAALSSNEGTVRQRALEALGRLFPNDPTRVSLLALQSRFADVSEPAARHLAMLGDPVTLVERLGQVKQRAARQRLRAGLVRRRACPIEQLAQLLQADDPGPRADAAWIAGESGEPLLREAVEEATKRVVARWAERVAEAARQRFAETHLDEDRTDELYAVLWAGHRLGASIVDEALTVVKTASAPGVHRVEAARYLGVHGAPRVDAVHTALRECLTSGDADLRRSAALALARLAREAGGTVDPSEAVEQAVVPDSAALVPLVRVVDATQRQALFGSAKGRCAVLPIVLSDGQTELLLARARGEGEGTERLTAIGSLGRLGGEQATQALSELATDQGESETVRKVAYRALRRAQRAAARAARFAEEAET